MLLYDYITIYITVLNILSSVEKEPELHRRIQFVIYDRGFSWVMLLVAMESYKNEEIALWSKKAGSVMNEPQLSSLYNSSKKDQLC